MATQGPSYPGTVTTASVSTENANDWLTPTNISADDAAEAQITAATYDSPDISFRLIAANFGFTIPTGSTIDGITVEIDRRSIIASSGVDFRVQLQDASAALVGANKASATVWPSTLTVATYGGAADTWTASPTVAMVNDADFGVVLSVTANIANADIGVDYIRMTITYTANPNATATPATVAAIASVPAPTVQGSAISTPVRVVATAAVPTPTLFRPASDWSTSAADTTQAAGAFGQVTNLTAVAQSTTSILLDWDDPDAIGHFQVERDSSILVDVGANLTAMTYLDTACAPSTTYTYRVRAYAPF